MIAETAGRIVTVSSAPGVPRLGLARLEDLAVTLTLSAMVLLPIAEIVLRRTLHTGIVGASIIVQHLGLVAGMLGGAIAAREKRMLALSTLGDSFLRRGGQAIGRATSGAVGGTVSGFLAIASYRFVESERPFSKILAYGIPIWVVELALPIGFAVISARLISQSANRWSGRLAVAMAAAGMAVALARIPEAPASLFLPALSLLALATVLGTPAFVTLGGTALLLFWRVGEPIAAIPVSHYSLVTNASIPALPLFTLAGYLLAESRAPERLVRVFDVFLGRLPGGPAVVTVIVCSFFTSFTGASGVTILALGGLLMPILIRARYSERDALGLVTG